MKQEERFKLYKKHIKALNPKVNKLEKRLKEVKKEREKFLMYFRTQKQRGKITDEEYEQLLK